VKDTFADLTFKRKHNLAAINSINWARILAQTVYYFYSYFQVSSCAKARIMSPLIRADLFLSFVYQITSPAQQKAGAKVVFSVPTGNFGNVLAGFYAKQMGLPVHQFIVATNQNEYRQSLLLTSPAYPPLGLFLKVHRDS
jgi:threonine synthase